MQSAQSEDHLRLVINTIPALVWSALPDGSIDFINQRHREFTGLSLNDVCGWRWVDVIHPDDRTSIVEKWHKALATGKPLNTEARLRRVNGDYRWLLICAVPLQDESGKIVKWYGTKTDIAELKQAEDEVRQSENRIRLIITLFPPWRGVFSLVEPLILLINGGWIMQDLLWRKKIKNPTSIIHPDDLLNAIEKWRANLVCRKVL